MPVFRCTSCGRLLYRPENLLGRAGMCPTCGPITLSDATVQVDADLAVLLEKEYQVTLLRFNSSAVSASPTSEQQGEGAPQVPSRPPRPRAPWGEPRQGEPDLTVPTAPRVVGLAGHVMAALFLVLSLLGA